jgi:Ankyrin repeats (3 copies)
VCFDRLEVAELLIQHKADVNATQRNHGDSPLCVACRKGLLPLVELLVRSGARINQAGKNGETPLHCALENKHESVAQFLVGASASVNVLDVNGMSSLHVACKYVHLPPQFTNHVLLYFILVFYLSSSPLLHSCLLFKLISSHQELMQAINRAHSQQQHFYHIHIHLRCRPCTSRNHSTLYNTQRARPTSHDTTHVCVSGW